MISEFRSPILHFCDQADHVIRYWPNTNYQPFIMDNPILFLATADK